MRLSKQNQHVTNKNLLIWRNIQVTLAAAHLRQKGKLNPLWSLMMEGNDVRLMGCFAFDVRPTSSPLINYVANITLNGRSMKMKIILSVIVTLAV